ncbi:MAG: DUF1700 domain-containing protein [Lachnospiraceae bacterium]|nr:DUF1700 domain-containing protein [Lachnospiraceae bacterium]
MRKEEYLEELRKYLRRLPKEDYESAIDYFTEYFEEAGPEAESEIIKELGTPKEAANELLNRLLDEKTEMVKKDHRNVSLKSIVVIAILAIFAAPVGVPIAITLVLMLFVLLLIVFVMLLAVICCGAAFLLGGAKVLIQGLIALATSASGGIMITGVGLAALGTGIILVIAACWFCKVFSVALFRLISVKLCRKGGR